MKKLILFIALQLMAVTLYSQAPQFINYQAVARNVSGNPIASQDISIKFEFKQGATPVFTETQSVTTNASGLFSTQIGKITSLGSVDWQAGAISLVVSVDPLGGSNFTAFSSQQLVSVPYALHAATVPSSYTNNILTIGGKTYTLSASGTAPTSVTATSGIATITSAGTNTFDVHVPAPVFDPATGALTTGTAVTNITPGLSLNGGVLTSGPSSNSVVIPSPAAATITGIGASTVTSSGNNYTVNVITPTLTGAGTTTVSGSYPNYTVSSSPAASPTITGVGVSTVTSSGNSYTVNVATPNLTGLGTTTVTGAYPNYSINTAAAIAPTLTGLGTTTVTGSYPNYSINTASAASPTITGVGVSTVTSSGNSYTVNVATPNLTGLGTTTVTGAYPNYSINTASAASSTITGVGVSTVTSSGNSYTVNVATPNLTGLGTTTVTGAYPNYSINTASAASPSITGVGVSTVTSSGNNYTVNVATPTLTGLGTTTVTGAYPNYSINTASAASPSITGVGVSTVTSSGNNYTVNVATPTLTGLGTTTVTGAYPNYSINTASAASPSITGVGVSTVTSSGNNYTVNVATPTLTGLGTTTVSGTYPNYTISSAAPAAVTPSLVGTGAAQVATLSANSYSINVPQTTITSGTNVSVAGSFPNYTISSTGPWTRSTGSVSLSTPADNVGIGTATPAQKLDVVGNIQLSGALMPAGSAGTSGQVLQSSGAGAAPVWTNVAASGWGLNGNTGTSDATNFIGTTDAVGLVFKTNNSEAVRIDKSGNVGIAGIDPDSKFTVNRSATGTRALGVNSTQNYNGTGAAGGHATAGLFTNNFSGTGGPQVFSGISGIVALNSGANSSQISTGGWLNALISGGTHNAVHGLYASVELGSASVTNAYAGRFEYLGSTPATNAYGAYVGTVNGINKWSFYAADATAPSYFAGSLHFYGDLAPGGLAGSAGQVLQSSGPGSPPVWAAAPSSTFAFSNTTGSLTSGASSVYITPSLTLSGSTLTSGPSTNSVNLASLASPWTQSGGTVSIASTTVNVSIGGTSAGALLSLNNNSVTSRHGITLAGGRDLIGAGMPVNLEIVTNAQTFGTNTYGRIIRMSNATLGSSFDMGIDQNSSLFISRLNQYNPTADFAISSSGNSGFGKSAPTERIDVSGNVRFSGALMPNNAAGTTGQILQSNGAGAAPTWVNNAGSGWGLLGNATTTAGTNFLGTTDAQDVVFKSNNVEVFRAQSAGVIRLLSGSDRTITMQTQTSNIDANNLMVKGSDAGMGGQARYGGALILQGGDGYNQSNTIHFGGSVVIRPGKNLYGAAAYNSGNVIFQSVTSSNAYIESARIDGSGNLGIGTTTPSEKLDVVGNIEVPATNDYRYASAKTNYATISPASFTALNGIIISGNTYARWFSGGTAGTADIMYATIQLPNGATITGMDAYVLDNNGSYDVTATLAVVNMATNSNVLLAGTASTSGASTAAVMISATGLSHVVDNSTNNYYIMFNSRQNSTDLWIRGARVTYTVLKAD